jgi:diguanylate cyclase (GGDEF)-like protein/PAS domain S-box-containing protein
VHKQSILLVDDKQANLTALESLLEDFEVELVSAFSGPEALSILLNKDFALVLLDVQMPGMDGFEVAELMRSRKRTANIPIIFVTAIDNSQQHMFKGYESGAVDFLSKPIEPLVLRSKVNIFLQLDFQKQMLESSLLEVQQLKTSNELLLQSVGEGITGINEEGVFTFLNPAAENMLGLSARTLIGKHVNDFVASLQPDYNGFDWQRTRLYRQCCGNKKAYKSEATVKLKHRITTIEYNATPIVALDGGFSGVVLVFQDITERHEMENKLNFMAQYDALTGLGNRNLFADSLRRAMERTDTTLTPFSLLFIDLDRFKQVNDTLGHDVGDMLLKDVTARLRDCAREQDTICRLGGDEFTIMLEGSNIKRAAQRVAEKVIYALSSVFEIDGHDVFIGASIGIVIYPESADNVSELIKNADISMYQAKHLGRNRFQFFCPSLKQEVEEALSLELNLRQALTNGEFELFYQPKLSLPEHRIVGLEALIRWRTAEGEFISPGDFIPLAEETGLIKPIGEWVLEQACADAKAWDDIFNLGQDFSIGVNFSVKQLNDGQVIDVLKRILHMTQVSPALIELEITESVVMENTAQMVELLKEIHEMGLLIALDDFGTGYSSMNYLTQLPLHVLKIDRSFVDGIGKGSQQRAIVNAIISLAESLSLKVVAEGVETVEQLEFLTQRNCSFVQGFYFSRPLPREEVEVLLRQQYGS